ncbi:DHH family phosphoesterase [Aquimarina brevivitae]|uniref:Phosphoesterase RecJ-like protein n=1 Tax=Aquimarina brevivitae TaxID=323412 RepID=A0A4Q7P3J9_9FLAO|nr:bifunctional oligoribonuclease/PAP phosphatase NrnA [Aquimarina brevivitae]RZS93252.1 phosphoesterase RecJ-like protein [Aquimarina brevivitae]
MNEKEIQEVKELLSHKKKISITAHKNPDGDAIGSSLGLYHYLVKLGHEVSVIMPNDYPEFLKWVPGNTSVLNYEQEQAKADTILQEADIIFTLDYNHLSRTGDMETILSSVDAEFIMIDHHQQPDSYARFMYSDVSMSSTCQMIYHFIELLGDVDKIDAATATCIYLGIMTDTGSFRFRSTNSVTHQVVAQLIEKGADNSAIHEQVYDTNSVSRLQLKGVALTNLNVLDEYKTAYITMSQEELDRHSFKKGDTEGFVNIGLSIAGIVFAVIFIENKQEGIIKISFRSKGSFSVNEFAREHFEGGGHTNAAGGKSNLSLQDTVDKFISILPSYKNALNL